MGVMWAGVMLSSLELVGSHTHEYMHVSNETSITTFYNTRQPITKFWVVVRSNWSESEVRLLLQLDFLLFQNRSRRIQYREIQHGGLFASHLEFTLHNHVHISFDAEGIFTVHAVILKKQKTYDAKQNPGMCQLHLILKTRQPYKIQKWK
jgi:hypothetical protein